MKRTGPNTVELKPEDINLIDWNNAKTDSSYQETDRQSTVIQAAKHFGMEETSLTNGGLWGRLTLSSVCSRKLFRNGIPYMSTGIRGKVRSATNQIIPIGLGEFIEIVTPDTVF